MNALRQVTAWLLVLACLVLGPAAVVAQWAGGTLLDTDRFVAVVAPLASDPVVQGQVTTEVASAITAQIDVDRLLAAFLPGVPPGPADPERQRRVDEAVAGAVEAVVSSPRFAAIWTGVNTRVHAGIVALLRGGDGGVVRLSSGALVIDGALLFVAVRDALAEQGLGFVRTIAPPPGVDREVVVLSSRAWSRLQAAYDMVGPVAGLAVAGVALLMLLAVGVAARRAGVVMGVAVVLGWTGLVVLAALAVLPSALDTGLRGTPLSGMGAAFAGALSPPLRDVVPWLFGLALVAIVAAIVVSRLESPRSTTWAGP